MLSLRDALDRWRDQAEVVRASQSDARLLLLHAHVVEPVRDLELLDEVASQSSVFQGGQFEAIEAGRKASPLLHCVGVSGGVWYAREARDVFGDAPLYAFKCSDVSDELRRPYLRGELQVRADVPSVQALP